MLHTFTSGRKERRNPTLLAGSKKGKGLKVHLPNLPPHPSVVSILQGISPETTDMRSSAHHTHPGLILPGS